MTSDKILLWHLLATGDKSVTAFELEEVSVQDTSVPKLITTHQFIKSYMEARFTQEAKIQTARLFSLVLCY